jgi:hypothetical protein
LAAASMQLSLPSDLAAFDALGLRAAFGSFDLLLVERAKEWLLEEDGD